MTPKEWQDIMRTLDALVPCWEQSMQTRRLQILTDEGYTYEDPPDYHHWIKVGEQVTLAIYNENVSVL